MAFLIHCYTTYYLTWIGSTKGMHVIMCSLILFVCVSRSSVRICLQARIFRATPLVNCRASGDDGADVASDEHGKAVQSNSIPLIIHCV